MIAKFPENSFVHPNIINWAMAANHRTLDKEGKAVAARLYLLTAILGNLEAHRLLDIAMGDVPFVVDNEARTITFDFPED
jgi:hypothetical protein